MSLFPLIEQFVLLVVRKTIELIYEFIHVLDGRKMCTVMLCIFFVSWGRIQECEVLSFKLHIQTMYFPKDFIKNIFSLQEKEIRKEKWVVYRKVLDLINGFEPKYNPLVDKKYWGTKMNMLMNNFPGIMKTLNEMKDILGKSYPNRVAEVERRINSRMVVTPCQHTL